MKKYKIIVGDSSNDGHGISEVVHIKCNMTIEDINDAYKKSCETTGLVFTANTPIFADGEKIDYKHPEYKDRRIFVDYQSNEISELAWKILTKYNIEESEIYDGEGLIDLFISFVKISLPELEWYIIDDKTPTLNIALGYGLY